jgi:hypothetical protein
MARFDGGASKTCKTNFSLFRSSLSLFLSAVARKTLLFNKAIIVVYYLPI